MLVAKRLEFIKEGFNHDGPDHREHEQNEHKWKPGEQPPPPGAVTHDREENEDQQDSNDNADDFFLGPIPKPGTPALHGLVVMQRKLVPVKAHRKIEHVNEKKERWNKNHSLYPADLAGAFRDVSKARGNPQAQDQKKENGAENVRQKIKRVARAGIGHRFFIFFVRESVLLRFRLVGRAGDERRNLSRRRKLRRALPGHW